jgi:two-component system sensor histidine kinase KdpD
VSVEVEGDNAPAWFDPHLLGRVLRHLLENAARHTPQGSRVKLKSWRSAERLEFSVEDNGPGIDSLDLPLIFEKFYRGKRSAHKGKGSGMGLAITRAILLAHGGGIEAHSAPGKGAGFRFWIPLVEKEPVKPLPGELPKVPVLAVREASTPQEPLKNKRVRLRSAGEPQPEQAEPRS